MSFILLFFHTTTQRCTMGLDMYLKARKYISTWNDENGPKRLSGTAAHKMSVRDFFSSNITNGATISRWAPSRIQHWSRCSHCGAINAYSVGKLICACGAAVPEGPPLW